MNGVHPTPARYLDYLAHCRQAFTPFAPIELPDFFAGRAHIIEDIRGELEAPGRQVAIYGERGAGKTSLAALLCFFAQYDEEGVHTFRCTENATFEDICVAFLSETGGELRLEERQTETGRAGEARLGPLSASSSRRAVSTYRSLENGHVATPARMLACFGERPGLLIIDEFDRIEDSKTKTRMAEMIKHFSDARSQTKIVVVGVAQTLNDLIGEHESLSRSLAQIRLDRMDQIELEDIISRGSARTGARFEASVRRRIVLLADGFPHFVHLACLYASLYAGESLQVGTQVTPQVGEREYQLGIKSAIAKSEHTLHEAYERATVTTRRKSEIYALTLRAMALTDERTVQVREIAEHASWLTGGPLRPEKFSNPLGELVKDDRGKVLSKVRDGYYKFTNPLLRPYVRFRLEFENLTLHKGQLEFPFMRGA